MKNGDATEFYKLLELYLEGVITKYEFFDIVDRLPKHFSTESMDCHSKPEFEANSQHWMSHGALL